MSGRPNVRKNWTLSVSIALAFAVAAAVLGCMTGTKPVETDRLYITSTAGNVLFDHGKHNETADSCASCHHDLLGAELATPCAECHDDEFEPADFEHAELKEFHGRDCLNCHEQTREDDQIESCRSCHPGVQQREDRFVGCTECHDEDYEPDMMGHDEYVEIEDHSCLDCHAPGSVSESFHTSCTGCHLEAAPQRFANADETVKCSACHLR